MVTSKKHIDCRCNEGYECDRCANARIAGSLSSKQLVELTADQAARALDIQEDCRQLPRWASRTIVRYEDRSVELWNSFKNFHRLLCERFGYVHDENDWQRDQLSLIEHIAQRASAPPPDPLAISHLRGLVYHWNEFGPAMCLEEKMHYAHEWLKRHDESTAVTKEGDPTAFRREVAGKQAYLNSQDDSIHRNRYPAWHELTQSQRDEWITRAAGREGGE